MSFWLNFKFPASPVVEAILEKEDFTLEELLDEQEVLVQECKAQNKKLLEFLTSKETLKKLIDYVTVEPEEDADPNRRCKYPFVAREVLCSAVWQICDAVYNEEELLDQLYAFLDKSTEELDAANISCSCNCRVAGILWSQKITQTITHMKKNDSKIIEKIVNHIANSQVMEFLRDIISCAELTIESSAIEEYLDWLSEENLIGSLISKFEQSYDSQVHDNAAQALISITNIDINFASPLSKLLTSEETVLTLVKNIFSAADGSSVVLHGVIVLNELLKQYIVEDTVTNETVEEEKLPPILKALLQNLDKFVALLTPTGDQTTLSTTCTTLNPPFGFARLQVMELFLRLLRTKYKCIEEKLISLKVINTCLDLFFSYPFNNFLHHVVNQILMTILDGENNDLIMSLFVDGQFLTKIIEAEKSAKQEATDGKLRRTYMGFVNIITDSIENTASAVPELDKLLTENEEWKEYVEGPYNTAVLIEQQCLGPKPSGFADLDESSDEEETDGVFANYKYGFGFNNDNGEEEEGDEDYYGSDSSEDEPFSDSEEEEEEEDDDNQEEGEDEESSPESTENSNLVEQLAQEKMIRAKLESEVVDLNEALEKEKKKNLDLQNQLNEKNTLDSSGEAENLSSTQ